MRFLKLGFGVSVVLVMTVRSASIAEAQDCATILTKVKANYGTARTYSASIITHQKSKTKEGQPFAITSSESIKYKAPNLINVVITLKGTGAGSDKFSENDKTFVSDGKVITAYVPSKKLYGKRKSPSNITVPDLLEFIKNLPNANGEQIISRLADRTFSGRSAYVVEIRLKMPSTYTPAQQLQWKAAAANAGPVRVTIDKRNFQLLQITEISNGVAVDINLNDQVFNSNIPVAAFSFVPPPGSKEMQPSNAQRSTAAPGSPLKK